MKSPRRNDGFSLLEVLCAILILGVALAGLTEGITTALRSNKESELQTTAALIAAGQIETLRAEGEIVDGETEGEGGAGLERYQWKRTVSKADIDGLHDVSVVVENTKTRQSIYELRTMLFEPPTDDSSRSAPKGNSSKSRSRRRGRDQ